MIIHPIQINLTFKNLNLPKDSSFIINFLKNVLGRALANFDHAPITLKGIEVQFAYGTTEDIIKQMLKRYVSSIAETVVGVLFSNNLIGNPVKFFERISGGVTDLIDKPIQGFNEGPLEGGLGLMLGASSFACKTVGATFDSIHQFTEAIATGLSGMVGVRF